MLSVKGSLLPLLLVTLFALVLAAPIAHAQAPPIESGQDEALERMAQDIDRMIMCPVCPAETIDQAQVEISFQMRAIIREMLAEGKSREQVLDYFVDRYGADILAAPPKSGSNLVAWILPIVGIAAGLGGVLLVIRAMTRRERPATASPEANPAAVAQDETRTEEGDPALAPYLEIVDRLLASRRNLRSPDGPSAGVETENAEQPRPGGSHPATGHAGGEA